MKLSLEAMRKCWPGKGGKHWGQRDKGAQALTWARAWAVLGAAGVSLRWVVTKGWSSEECESKAASPVWGAWVSLHLQWEDVHPGQLHFPQVTEDVLSPSLKPFKVSGNPLNPRGWLQKPTRGQVIDSSYLCGSWSRKGTGVLHPSGNAPSLLFGGWRNGYNQNINKT